MTEASAKRYPANFKLSELPAMRSYNATHALQKITPAVVQRLKAALTDIEDVCLTEAERTARNLPPVRPGRTGAERLEMCKLLARAALAPSEGG